MSSGVLPFHRFYVCRESKDEVECPVFQSLSKLLGTLSGLWKYVSIQSSDFQDFH